jgi:hypothetical protein
MGSGGGEYEGSSGGGGRCMGLAVTDHAVAVVCAGDDE